jgi:hypothetical protein
LAAFIHAYGDLLPVRPPGATTANITLDIINAVALPLDYNLIVDGISQHLQNVTDRKIDLLASSNVSKCKCHYFFFIQFL